MKPGYYEYYGEIFQVVEGPTLHKLLGICFYLNGKRKETHYRSLRALDSTPIPYMNTPLYKAMYG